MDYKENFNQDNDYQEIVNEFKSKKGKLDRMIEEGVYDKAFLREIGTKIGSDLRNNIAEFHQSSLESIKGNLKHFENKSKSVGYADRPNEAKELEMRYKLASDRELSLMVEDLNTNDLLEVNLLRMELKKRNLDQIDKKAKHYVIRHGLEGLDEMEQKEYDELNQKLATFSTMGKGNVIIDNQLKPLDKIEKNIWTDISNAKGKGDMLEDRKAMQEKILSQF